MLNANQFIMPKPQSDGTVADGFEQLRQGFMEVHMEELSMVIKMIKALPPESASVQTLNYIIQETDQLQRRWKSYRP